MKFIRNITSTLSASVEHAVTHLENHDAVVQAALRDTRRTAAKAKVSLARVKRDGVALRAKLKTLQNYESTWEERAARVAHQDEPKALECLRRRNQCRVRVTATEQALRDHEARETELTQAVTRIEQRLSDIETERNLLRTRQSTAETQRRVGEFAASSDHQLDDVLERWEARILETEYALPGHVASDQDIADSLDNEFKQDEDIEVLRTDLDELLAKNERSNDPQAADDDTQTNQ